MIFWNWTNKPFQINLNQKKKKKLPHQQTLFNTRPYTEIAIHIEIGIPTFRWKTIANKNEDNIIIDDGHFFNQSDHHDDWIESSKSNGHISK